MSTYLFLRWSEEDGLIVDEEPGIANKDREDAAVGKLTILRFNGALWRYEKLYANTHSEYFWGKL